MMATTRFKSAHAPLDEKEPNPVTSLTEKIPKDRVRSNAFTEEGRIRSDAITFNSPLEFETRWINELKRERDKIRSETQLAKVKEKIDALIQRLDKILETLAKERLVQRSKETLKKTLFNVMRSFIRTVTKKPVSSDTHKIQMSDISVIDNLEQECAGISTHTNLAFFIFRERVEKLKQKLDKIQQALPHNVTDFDSLEFIPLETRIQTSDNYRFDIASLVTWINTKKQYNNPYNRQIFNEEDKALIQDFAKKANLTIDVNGIYQVEENEAILQSAISATQVPQDVSDNLLDIRRRFLQELLHPLISVERSYPEFKMVESISPSEEASTPPVFLRFTFFSSHQPGEQAEESFYYSRRP